MIFTGYRAYRGIGGIGAVDFATPVGSVSAPSGSITLAGLGHVADTTYTYVIRPVVNGLETPDVSCVTTFVTDGSGDWAGNRPDAVDGFGVEVVADGKVRMRWRSHTPHGAAPPDAFAIHHGPSLPVDTSGPAAATESYTADGRHSVDLSLASGQTYYFAITAVSAAGVAGPASVAGPVVAAGDAPMAPVLYTNTSF